jgi:predicted transcriptional regulator
MKAVLMSIKPKYVAKILNGEKTIEVRKKFTTSYRGWVYIYCTKDKQGIFKERHNCYTLLNQNKWIQSEMNGKVVARFYCDNVEEIKNHILHDFMETKSLSCVELKKQSCLDLEDLYKYLDIDDGYAIHISKLEIFDEPKELSEFYPYCKDEKCEYRNNHCSICYRPPLTKAPQSWRYIEVDE